ncbi:unnamed protein product [Rotaria sp. Silwood1]|nr:unnamed protein product [Rotaria sp. Silwood1]CAF1597326.1 unnamed protein product [Rotaria sp. Silwood1]
METAFNRAKELVSNLNILPSLKKCNACELNSLSKNIFDSIRFNINSDTYSATDADSSSDSESDYDDETMESNEFNSDLINVDEEDKDAATTQSVDEIKTEKINFTADIKLEDFENESAQAVQRINAWVEQQTNKLIRNLLSTKDITPETRLILINSIYFKGTWIKEFNQNLTKKDADFYETNGKISKVTLMHQREKYAYAENNDLYVQIVHVPYISENKDVEFVFTVILPNRGAQLDVVEQKLASQSDLIQKLLSHQNTRIEELHLYLPKFKMEATFELSNILQQLGMKDAFNSYKANFTGIASEKNDRDRLYISKVIHKAFIDVNEEGSEAAAATAVIITHHGPSLPPPQPIEFKADRPFLFFIRESRQNIVLFSGKFISPPINS